MLSLVYLDEALGINQPLVRELLHEHMAAASRAYGALCTSDVRRVHASIAACGALLAELPPAPELERLLEDTALARAAAPLGALSTSPAGRSRLFALARQAFLCQAFLKSRQFVFSVLLLLSHLYAQLLINYKCLLSYLYLRLTVDNAVQVYGVRSPLL